MEPQLERLVPVYKKTEVLVLQTFLCDKFTVWASNGSSVEELWNNFKNIIHESVELFVPHKILRKFRILIITIKTLLYGKQS